MDLEANKNIAREFLTVLRTSDGNLLAAICSESAVIETIGSMAVSARKSPKHVAKELGVLRRIFPDGMVLDLVTMTAEDNRVICELSGRNTTHDGMKYDNRYVFVIEIDDDKIREVREYQDTMLVESVLMPTFKSLGVIANSAAPSDVLLDNM